MKKTILAACLTAACSTGFAQSYWHATIGSMDADAKVSRGELSVENNIETRVAFGAGLGYRVNNYFALEGGLDYHGTYPNEGGGTVSGYSVKGLAVGIVPVSSYGSLRLKAGLAYSAFDISGTTENTGAIQDTYYKVAPVVGGGFTININSKMDFVFDVERYASLGEAKNFVQTGAKLETSGTRTSMGIQYKF